MPDQQPRVKAAEQPKPWVGQGWIKVLKGRHRDSVSRLQRFVYCHAQTQGLRPGLCYYVLSALGVMRNNVLAALPSA